MNDALTLRPATIEDAEQLLAWRNDPATREASHNTASVPSDEHLSWLEKTLDRSDRMLLIAEENTVSVGSVRADLEDDVWELSWTVASEARGQGVARRMVFLLASQISKPIRAEVKAGNTASARIAENAGMVLGREVDGVLHYRREALTLTNV